MRLNQRRWRTRANRSLWAVPICLAAAISGQAQQLGDQRDSTQAPRPASNLTLQGAAVPQGLQDGGAQVQVNDQNKPSGLTQHRPVVIETPPLVLHAFEPLVIETSDLVISAFEPLVIDTPALSIVAHEPIVIGTPDLLIVTDKDDEIANDSATPTPLAGGSGATPTPLPGQNASPPSLAGSAPTAERVAPRLCVGEYTIHSASAAGSGYGNPKMPLGTPVMAKATLSTESCGAFLTLKTPGQKILLARQHGDKNVYQGKLHVPDGAKRVMTLTCGQNLTLYGGIVARDDRAQVSRQLWLQLDRVNEAVLASCAEAK